MIIVKEFKISDLITLKLEKTYFEKRTVIWIAGKPFTMCLYLLLVVPQKIIDENVESIDEAAEIYSYALGDRRILAEDIGLTPEQEFIGHCSNIQAWYEHSYDVRMLHSNLSFSLLKELCIEGDEIARKRYYEQLLDRFYRGTAKIREFLYDNDYFDDLPAEMRLNLICSEQERQAVKLMEDIIHENFNIFFNLDKHGPIQSQQGFYYIILDRNTLLVTGISFGKKINLKTASKWIKNFKELSSIRVAEHKILSWWLDILSSLRTIKFYFCDLQEFPKFEFLKQFETLCINYCRIEKLPEYMSNLEDLKELDLGNNQLEYLPGTFGYLKKLEILNLENNSIRFLPESFGNLNNLRVLNLIRNPLNSLPVSFKNLNNLESLKVFRAQSHIIKPLLAERHKEILIIEKV